MTAPTPSGPTGGPEEGDVLSAEEEAALARIRDIVADVRAHEAPASADAVERALVAAGALKEEGPAGRQSHGFMLCGARFWVETGRHASGAVEINFVSEA